MHIREHMDPRSEPTAHGTNNLSRMGHPLVGKKIDPPLMLTTLNSAPIRRGIRKDAPFLNPNPCSKEEQRKPLGKRLQLQAIKGPQTCKSMRCNPLGKYPHLRAVKARNPSYLWVRSPAPKGRELQRPEQRRRQATSHCRMMSRVDLGTSKEWTRLGDAGLLAEPPLSQQEWLDQQSQNEPVPTHLEDHPPKAVAGWTREPLRIGLILQVHPA